MHLSVPLYARPYLNREYTAPTLSNALFGSRYWVATLLFSMALHLLIVIALPWLNQINLEPASMQPITASFKEAHPTPAAMPAFEPPLPEILPKPETPIEPIQPKVIKKPTPKVIEKPVLQSITPARASDFTIAEQTPETAAPDEAIQPEATMTQSSNPSPQPSATPNTNANTNPNTSQKPPPTTSTAQHNNWLNAYGSDLQRLCERNKQYPVIAIRRNLEGAGSVLVRFNKDGSVLSINIENSTGQSSLDDQAIKMVEKSLSALPLPSQLRGQVMTLSVPVSFALQG